MSDYLSSTALTTNSSGARIAELRYHPYGGTRYSYGTTPTSFRFTGQQEDGTIGLYFYNARYYDPALGRFVQADTIVPQAGNPQDLNRYSYVRNNALKMVDPSGHCGGNILTGETYCSGFSTLTVDGNLSGAPIALGPLPSTSIGVYHIRPDDGVILAYATQTSVQLRQEWVLMHGEARAFGVSGFAEVRSVRTTPLLGGGAAASFEEMVVGGGPAAKAPILGGVGIEALSLIPFSAPVAMLMRMTSTAVPAWQVGVSLVLLVLTGVGMVLLMARLFRAQTLLGGESFPLARFWAAVRGGA